MQPRFHTPQLTPDLYRAVSALDLAVTKSDIDKRLLHLIKIRASQINQCAYCIDLHIKHAIADGIDQQTINLISAWQESPLFDARDRAALAWTESVTRVADTHVEDITYEQVISVLNETEIATLTIAIGTINLWNRIGVASRLVHPID